MTPERQKEIITEFFDSLKERILEKSKRFPERWDGKLIRKYIEDTIREDYGNLKLSKKEVAQYNIDLYEKNL